MTVDIAGVLQQRLGASSVEEAVAQLTKDDPQLAALAQLLSQRQEEIEADLARQEVEVEDADLRQRALEEGDRIRRRERARDELNQLTADLDRLGGIVEALASALGACGSCAGSDPGCRLCHGQGRPGSMPPDPGDFDRLVMPAVRAHAFIRARHRRISIAGVTGDPTTEEGNAQ